MTSACAMGTQAPPNATPATIATIATVRNGVAHAVPLLTREPQVVH